MPEKAQRNDSLFHHGNNGPKWQFLSSYGIVPLLPPPPAAPEGAHLNPASAGFFLSRDTGTVIRQMWRCGDFPALEPPLSCGLLLNAVRREIRVILAVVVADGEKRAGQDYKQDSQSQKAEGRRHRELLRLKG